MKRISKRTTALLVSLLCLILFSFMAHADETPGSVRNFKATAEESAITLTWNTMTGITGYMLYQPDPETGTPECIDLITSPRKKSYIVGGLTNNKTYTFQIAAYIKAADGTRITGPISDPVTAKPVLTKPATTKLQVVACGDKYLQFSWGKSEDATGYELYQKNSKTGKYQKIGETKKLSAKVSKLTNGKSYSFKIRPYRKLGSLKRYGNYSKAVTAKPISTKKAIQAIRTMGYKCILRASFNAPKVKASGSVSLTAGSTIEVINRGTQTSIAQLSDGTQVQIPSGYLSWVSEIYDSSKDYSQTLVEGYVNYKGYSSTTKYMIWINLYRQRLYIFKGSQCSWKLIKNYQISSGKLPQSTPKGLYKIGRHAPTFIFDEDCFGYWATFFSGNAIHSWVYTGSPSNPGFKYLDGVAGKPASHGCVRVWTIQEAKEIYDLVPNGSTCVIY